MCWPSLDSLGRLSSRDLISEESDIKILINSTIAVSANDKNNSKQHYRKCFILTHVKTNLHVGEN